MLEQQKQADMQVSTWHEHRTESGVYMQAKAQADLPMAWHFLSKRGLRGVVLDLEHEGVTPALQAVPPCAEGLEELLLLHGIVAGVARVYDLHSSTPASSNMQHLAALASAVSLVRLLCKPADARW